MKKWKERASQSLADGEWKQDFAAKEILSDVVSRFRHRPGMSGPKDSTTILLNIAQEVAEQQRDERRISPDLSALKDAFVGWLIRRNA